MKWNILLALACVLSPSAWSQEPAPASNEIPSTFRAQVIVDQRTEAGSPRNRTNKLHCFILENDLNPTVAIFIRTIPADKDSPVGQLITALNKLSQEQRAIADNFGAFVIALGLDKEFHEDEERDVIARKVEDFAKAVAAPAVPWALAAKQSEQATKWKIGASDVTVVFYHRLKEVKRWEFPAEHPDANETAEIMSHLKKHLKISE